MPRNVEQIVPTGIAILLAFFGSTPTLFAAERPPNVILIMTDNHSPWTLGCYGNRDIRTPNIDRLATEGLRFTNAYSSNAVCSPTRATFLTGLLPSQHGVHSFLAGGFPQTGKGAYSTIGEFRSLGEILVDNGYVAGLSGKWHLGNNMTPQEGFTFWTTKPDGGSSEMYDQKVIENGSIRDEPTYLTDYWTRRGIEFIEKNRERPFFLFLAYNGPYGLGKLLLNNSKNQHAAYYADKDLPSFPREAVQPTLFNNREYINNPVSIRRYAAEVSGIDDGVGQVVEALQRLKLDRNTLIIFTADQGLAGGHNGYWGMGDHTRPLTGYDWTTHIPLIFWQPGAVATGVSDALVSNYDFLPTLLSRLGLSAQAPTNPRSPGRDFSPALAGKKLDGWDDTLFFEFDTVRSIRTKEWKLIAQRPSGPDELYNLRDDPAEKHNLWNDPSTEMLRGELRQQMDAFFAKHADPRYDLWKGGQSKAPLLSQKKEK